MIVVAYGDHLDSEVGFLNCGARSVASRNECSVYLKELITKGKLDIVKRVECWHFKH